MITAVLFSEKDFQNARAEEFLRNPLVDRILIVGAEGETPLPERCEAMPAADIFSGKVWNDIVARVSTDYLLYVPGDVRLDLRALERLLSTAVETGAGMVYADYGELSGEAAADHPVMDYQEGSIRDDFDFGPLILVETAAARNALKKYGAIPPYRWAGWYDLRLKIAAERELFHLPERLALIVKIGAGDGETSNRGHFSYVDPRNQEYQREMEEAATAHLKRIGAWLPPGFRKISPVVKPFPVEASVVIPVRNRVKTIGDAVKSALAQKAEFPFNVIVVDNHSTDGTTELLEELAASFARLKLLVPERRDLSIGGCWNEAVFSSHCGRYAIQLDSDDLYAADDVLSRLVRLLRTEQCALAVGAYTIVDADLREIPPGLIDHREWSEENGRNNLLRVNGMGAPRAFDTAVLRQVGFPNVGYGEDYAVALRLSRECRVGRIYDSLYLCRRWDGNTDAVLSIAQANRYNAYKDSLRTVEIKARRAIKREKDIPDDN
jgi:GT2 family glycosyltransferase